MLRLKSTVVFLGLFLTSHCLAQDSTAASTSDSTRPPVSERVRVSEILISTPQPYDPAKVTEAQQKAEKMLAAIRRGSSFADLARVNSQGSTAAAGGDIGYFTHGVLAPPLDELVFRLNVRDVSDVVRAKRGFLILKVTERLAAKSVTPTTEPTAEPSGTSSDKKQQPTSVPAPTTPLAAIQQAAHEAATKHAGRGDYGLGTGAPGRLMDGVEILSDTQGVDLGPYVQNVMQIVKKNWYSLIPKPDEMKRGKLAIEFAITKDGQLAGMKLVATSGDRQLDRAAWGGITASTPFRPLPSEFIGKYLALRFRFSYNPDTTSLAPN